MRNQSSGTRKRLGITIGSTHYLFPYFGSDPLWQPAWNAGYLVSGRPECDNISTGPVNVHCGWIVAL